VEGINTDFHINTKPLRNICLLNPQSTESKPNYHILFAYSLNGNDLFTLFGMQFVSCSFVNVFESLLVGQPACEKHYLFYGFPSILPFTHLYLSVTAL
jgi:hypothetical protein